MQFTTNSFNGGFGRVNSLLGASSHKNTCQIVWDESNAVVVKNSYFDEDMFRRTKLAILIDKESSLSINELRELLDEVLNQHPQLLLDISYAAPMQWKDLDRRLDTLLAEALIEAEHKAHLRKSMNNIQQAQNLLDGWMSYQDVNAMVALSQKRRFDSPSLGKFVNCSRQ